MLRVIAKSTTESFSGPIGAAEKTSPNFGQTLTQVQSSAQGELNLFLNRIDSLGKRLGQTLSLNDLAEFKATVQSFLRTTFGKSRRMLEETFYDFSGRPKILARISKINQSLDELGEQIINEHAKQFEVLKKVDEIRGLILDLFI